MHGVPNKVAGKCMCVFDPLKDFFSFDIFFPKPYESPVKPVPLLHFKRKCVK